MHPAINGARVAQVAEKLGYPPITLSDFVPVGTMRATAKGLATCQSEEFACMLHGVLDALEKDRKRAKDMECALMLFGAAHVCVDENNRIAGEPKTMLGFINANLKPLARLLQPAMMIRYPGVLREMGL
jgi:hypothetical protein